MRLLLLAGTGDARRIAQGLVGTGVTTIASLAGVTRQPIDLPCEIRVGGFGGAEGFGAYLKAARIDAVVDATHPFAATMSRTAARVCTALSLAHVQMLRPQWQAGPGDNWHEVAAEADVAKLVPLGATVFLATGRQTLTSYDNMSGRRLICRQIDPPDQPFPFANGAFLVGRPPFTVQDEVDLFQKLGIDWLVVKNSGGQASHSKLDAARLLGIPVAMVKRPPQPECARLSRVPEVLDWVAQRAAS